MGRPSKFTQEIADAFNSPRAMAFADRLTRLNFNQAVLRMKFMTGDITSRELREESTRLIVECNSDLHPKNAEGRT